MGEKEQSPMRRSSPIREDYVVYSYYKGKRKALLLETPNRREAFEAVMESLITTRGMELRAFARRLTPLTYDDDQPVVSMERDD